MLVVTNRKIYKVRFIERIMTETIPFKEWQKLDLRVGTIENVEEHPNADKLFVLDVNIGDEKKRFVAGLRGHYDKNELVGKKVIVFVNLEPATLRGIKSEGMVLAAVDSDKVFLLQPDDDIENGARIR